MRIGLELRVFDAREPGQQRYLWRLGSWLGAAGHDVHALAIRPQRADVAPTPGITAHDWSHRSRADLRAGVRRLELDALLLNPERSRRFRGLQPNLLRSGYGTDHYGEKLRSFRRPLERALRSALRVAPWVLAERRWERAFYEARDPAPHVLAQSEYMRGRVLRTYRVPEDHVHVVHNGVDPAEFGATRRLALRAEQRLRWRIPDGAVCLLFIGHNYRLKGLWPLLRILARVADTPAPLHLLVVGRGTGLRQRRRATSMVERLGLADRVVLAGPVESSIEAFAAADALVHLSWHDSFGFVALEAMTSGLPVITTRYAGASELISHKGSGLLVDPGDEAEVEDAIRSLADEAVRQRLGRAAAEAAAPYDETRNFREVARILELAARTSPGPVR